MKKKQKKKQKKNEVRRKPDPTLERKSITIRTLDKIKAYMKGKDDFIFKSELVRNLNVDYNSVNVALAMLDDEKLLEYNQEGKIKLVDKK